MPLKRKRSEPELCSSPCSSSSIFSSPPSTSTIDVHPQAFHNMPPVHLNSRTLKRFRDNRPSEDQVHQHTLHLLFSAQQQQSPANPEISHQSPHQEEPAFQQRKQQSLHRFWTINSAPEPVVETVVRQFATPPSSCDDCGASLGNGGDLTTDNTACGACGKHVCFSCSVSNLGEEKRCLQCAGNKALGAIGWSSVGVSLC
ncbi:hypothetical protein ED733_006263 [Metarhizium rileyi]|uniref:Uncharacterized protein n=1 Tax=Metarhizium rileyi (strain RCEF 4871) TaxID=1649241 RepID=A0A5C6GJH3_METRR|nr:hypothetical protein ED733_006263 [Metarhizium rileyi]